MDNRRRYDWLAPVYDRMDLAEPAYKRKLRPKLFEGLGGAICEAAVGTGWNIPFYPAGANMVAFDGSPGMLLRARRRARAMGKPAKFAAMNVVDTGFADSRFDAVVAAFLFGVLEPGQQVRALRELARITTPGGEIRILDYTPSARPFRRLWMALWLPWEHLVYGGSFSRRTEGHVAEAGLEVISEEYLYKDIVRLMRLRHAGAGNAPG